MKRNSGLRNGDPGGAAMNCTNSTLASSARHRSRSAASGTARASSAREQPQVRRQHVEADQRVHVQEEEDRGRQRVGDGDGGAHAELRDLHGGAAQQVLVGGRDDRRDEVEAERQQEQGGCLRRLGGVVDRADQALDVSSAARSQALTISGLPLTPFLLPRGPRGEKELSASSSSVNTRRKIVSTCFM